MSITSKWPWPLADVVERDVAALVLLIDQDGVALREGAAPESWPESRTDALVQQRAEGERLGGRPVDALAGVDRLGACCRGARDACG